MRRIDLNINLIELIKKHECLYNMHNPQYKQLEYKEIVWNNIGKELGITADKVKKKWKNLRDSYRKYLVKTIQQGTGTHKQYKYADDLKFLDNITFHRPVVMNADVEVSTDLSSNGETMYETLGKQTYFDIENSPDDEMQEFIDESPTKKEESHTLNFPVTSAVQVFRISVLNNENDFTNHQTNTDNENCDNTSEVHEERITEDNEGYQAVSEVNDRCAESSEVIVQEEQKKDLHYMLIEEIKKYECIYNLASPQYNNIEYKERLWYKIGKRLGLTSKLAKSKWKSVRDAYKKYKHKTLTTSGFVKTYKYAEILKFLDNYATERISRFSLTNIPEPEVSTDLSNHDDDGEQQQVKKSSSKNNTKKCFEKSFAKNINSEPVNPKAITSRLFMLLANKINEANLSPQQRNDIEFTVSSIVYSKLGEHNKNNDVYKK